MSADFQRDTAKPSNIAGEPDRALRETKVASDYNDSLIPHRRALRGAGEVQKDGARRIAIYVRFSTENQGIESEQRQLQAGMKCAETLGGSVVKTYVDRAKSGMNVNREGLELLLADAEKGVFNLLLIESASRLSRDLVDGALILRKLASYGVELRKSSGSIMTLDAAIREILVAQIDRDQLINRFSNARSARSKRGESSQRIQFGFAAGPAPGVRIEHPIRANGVREAFCLAREGRSMSFIARQLSGKYPTPAECVAIDRDGGPELAKTNWTPAMVRSLLANPIYAGFLADARRTQTINQDSRRNIVEMNDPEFWDVSLARAPAIVSMEEWLEALEQQPSGRIVTRRGDWKGRPFEHLFLCGECGRPMRIVKANGALCYACPSLLTECEGVGFSPKTMVVNALTEGMRRWLAGHNIAEQPDAIERVRKAADLLAAWLLDESDVDIAEKLREALRSADFEVSLIGRRDAGAAELDIKFCDARLDGVSVKVPISALEPRVRGVPGQRRRTAERKGERDDWDLRISDKLWRELAPHVGQTDLNLRRTCWKPRNLLEAMLEMCLSDRPVSSIPLTVGPQQEFTRAATRAVECGFWKAAVEALQELAPQIVTGARLEKMDRYRDIDAQVRLGSSGDAEELLKALSNPDVTRRLKSVIDIMGGKRLDRAAMRRPALDEQCLAAWVLRFREVGIPLLSGLSSELVGEFGRPDGLPLERFDAKLARDLATRFEIAAGAAENPTDQQRLLAIAAYFEGRDRDEIARIGGVDWLRARRWISELVAAGTSMLKNRVAESGLTDDQIDELIRILENGKDPQASGAIINGRHLVRIADERFGCLLSENGIFYLIKKRYRELGLEIPRLHHGVNSQVVFELRRLIEERAAVSKR